MAYFREGDGVIFKDPNTGTEYSAVLVEIIRNATKCHLYHIKVHNYCFGNGAEKKLVFESDIRKNPGFFLSVEHIAKS